MNTNLKIACALLSMAAVFVSCDDFLDSKSNSKYNNEQIFENIDNAQTYIMGLYAGLASKELYETNLLYFKCDSDLESLNNANDGTYSSIGHYNADPGTQLIDKTWNKFYSVIDMANVALETLPASTLWTQDDTKEMAHRLYGEALTVRALCYYELIYLWGDVPYRRTPIKPGENYYITKTDRDLIYDDILVDLDEAQDYIPWLSQVQTTERFSKGFVKGLRARVALARGGYGLRNVTFETRRGDNWKHYYEIANQECFDIIQSGEHKLNPDFEDVFKSMHAYKIDMEYGEILFEVAFGRMMSGRIAETIGMSHSTSPSEPKYGRAIATIISNPAYYYNFDREDIRRDISSALFRYSGQDGVQRLISTEMGFRLTKWRRMWLQPSMGGDMASVLKTGVNWPLMRYSDVLLMYAETENELHDGPTAEAKKRLAEVRERAFDPSLYDEKVTKYIDSVSTDRETFFNAIVDERAWELGGELVRKYDLIRWNLLGKKIEQVRTDMDIMINHPDDPKYNWVPGTIYWRVMPDGETLEVYNPDFRTSKPSVPAGETAYTSNNWFGALSDSNKEKFFTRFARFANGYRPEHNNYLLPIANSVITASNGSIENDQWRPK